MLPTAQFAYRKGLGTCDMLLCLSHTLKSAIESGREARIVQSNFSSVLGLFEVLCCLYLHSFYQTGHSTLWWIVIGVNWLTNVVSGVTLGSVL